MKDSESEVHAQVRHIQRQLWLILLTATGPFLILATASILTATTDEKKLLISSTFIFAFGLALIATKVASHTAVKRHLKSIEEINEIKSDFIAVAAHQLKTPISAFVYTLDGLESSYKEHDTKAVELFIKDLKGSAHRLSLLTKNLLNVTLINNEASTAKMETFALRPRIEEVLTQLEPVRELQSVDLDTKIDISEDATVYCDPGLFYHVFENLLTNALKYTEKGSPVRLQVIDGLDTVQIAITNKASGLTQSDLQTLFVKYKRAKNTKTTRSDGFGLGLYITKKFVESWNGTISASFNDADKQITFSFTILKSAHKKDTY